MCYNKNVKHAIHFTEVISLIVRVKEFRHGYKVTQDDLAKAVGVTRQTIISLENGKYNASLQLAHRLAKYFGVPIEELFIFGEDE